MHGRRSLNLALIPIDHELEHTLCNQRRQKAQQTILRPTMGDQLILPEPPKKLRDYTAPAEYSAPSCIVLTPIVQRFEIRPQTIQSLPIFHGKEEENPYNHLKTFFNICSTFSYAGITEEQVRLRLFPFSLRDKALNWLDSLPAASINSWTELSKKFLSKYFPARKTNAVLNNIMSFRQLDGEQFHESWERYKDFYLQCPHHGIDTWQKVQYFYRGLKPQSRSMVDSTVGGSLMDKTADEAIDIFETICENSEHWDLPTTDSQVTAPPVTKKGGMYEVNSRTGLEAQVAALTKLLAPLVTKVTAQPCTLCASIAHDTANCPSNPTLEDVQEVNAFNGRPRNDPYSNTYNPGWKQHPNFSWSNSQNTLGPSNFSRPYQQSYQAPPVQQEDPSIKEMLTHLVKEMSSYKQEVASLKQSQSILEKSQSKLEVQLSQIATAVSSLARGQGQFPSQTEANPRNNEQVQAITTLRSGKIIDNKVGNHGEMEERKVESEHDKHTTSLAKAAKSDQQVSFSSNANQQGFTAAPLQQDTLPSPPITSLPFPQRAKQARKEKNMGDILEQFKKVQINIPLLEAIKQIPSYAKFLKDLCTNKRKFDEHEKVMLSEEVSAVLQRKLPQKLKDPGSFTVPCTIGARNFDRALLDLGASVNLMPYSVYEHLGLGELKPISISLQFADRSVKYPRGIIEDVLVKVDEFILPADFIVLDMEEVEIPDRELPLILGRPFMATAGTKIDVKEGLLTMTVQDTTVKFQVFEALKKPMDLYDCFHVEAVDRIIETTFIESSSTDPLEVCITQHGMNFDKVSVLAAAQELQAVNSYPPTSHPKFEVLPSSHAKLVPSIIQPPTLELKPLPKTLKYVYLLSRADDFKFNASWEATQVLGWMRWELDLRIRALLPTMTSNTQGALNLTSLIFTHIYFLFFTVSICSSLIYLIPCMLFSIF